MTQNDFAFRIDRWTEDGERIVEHVAGAEDFQIAMATYHAARKRWPKAAMTLRQDTRVIEDSRRTRIGTLFFSVVREGPRRRRAVATRGVRLKLALPRQLLSRLPTVSTATIVSTSSNPITIIGMPTRYDLAVPSAEGGWTGGRLHSSKYGGRYMLSWGSPAAIIKHRPVTKRLNAIHSGSIEPHRGPHELPSLKLRHARVICNEVVSRYNTRLR